MVQRQLEAESVLSTPGRSKTMEACGLSGNKAPIGAPELITVFEGKQRYLVRVFLAAMVHPYQQKGPREHGPLSTSTDTQPAKTTDQT